MNSLGAFVLKPFVLKCVLTKSYLCSCSLSDIYFILGTDVFNEEAIISDI